MGVSKGGGQREKVTTPCCTYTPIAVVIVNYPSIASLFSCLCSRLTFHGNSFPTAYRSAQCFVLTCDMWQTCSCLRVDSDHTKPATLHLGSCLPCLPHNVLSSHQSQCSLTIYALIDQSEFKCDKFCFTSDYGSIDWSDNGTKPIINISTVGLCM